MKNLLLCLGLMMLMSVVSAMDEYKGGDNITIRSVFIDNGIPTPGALCLLSLYSQTEIVIDNISMNDDGDGFYSFTISGWLTTENISKYDGFVHCNLGGISGATSFSFLLVRNTEDDWSYYLNESIYETNTFLSNISINMNSMNKLSQEMNMTLYSLNSSLGLSNTYLNSIDSGVQMISSTLNQTDYRFESMLMNKYTDPELLIMHHSNAQNYIDNFNFMLLGEQSNPINNATCSISVYNKNNDMIIESEKQMTASGVAGIYYYNLPFANYKTGGYFSSVSCDYNGETNEFYIPFDIEERNEINDYNFEYILSSNQPISLNYEKDYTNMVEGIPIKEEYKEPLNAVLGIAFAFTERFLMPLYYAIGPVLQLAMFPINFITLLGVGMYFIMFGGGVILWTLCVFLWETYTIFVAFQEKSPIDKIKTFIYYQVVPGIVAWNFVVWWVNFVMDVITWIFEMILNIIKLIPGLKYIMG